jgi:hypothetical protein
MDLGRSAIFGITSAIPFSVISTDRGTASVDAPAFAGLLDVLLLSGAYGVIVSSVHHPGGKHVAARRRQRVNAVGARLLFVRGPLRTATSTAGWNILSPDAIRYRAEETSDLTDVPRSG